MNYLLEILTIIEAAAKLDRAKVLAFARQLAEKMGKDGETKAASRILRALEPISNASLFPSGFGIQERIPVDNESRLNLADEIFIGKHEVEVFLPQSTMSVVDEFILHINNADLLLQEGLNISATMLLYGPPGCGKTELAKFIAATLNLPLVTARTDTLVSSYLGSTAKNLRLLFDHAASRPCVLFLDEFDSVAKLRDDKHELGELKRVVVSLLQNIDAIRNKSVLLAATNHEHLLDPAIWRRFSYRIKIDLPNTKARESIFKKLLNKHIKDKDILRMASASEGLSGSDIKELTEAALRSSIINNELIPLEYDILKRILSRTSGLEGGSIPSLIVWAKQKSPKIYSHQVLADIFSMTKGNISYILKKNMNTQNNNEGTSYD